MTYKKILFALLNWIIQLYEYELWNSMLMQETRLWSVRIRIEQVRTKLKKALKEQKKF